MSSLNHCIKFELDIKDENIVFINRSNCKSIKSMKQN
ncbi:Transposase [Lactobacillus helveticus CIRM-BIA 103]|nr:Transposase [Lactobacillus helveticus CIRM-BIA 103]